MNESVSRHGLFYPLMWQYMRVCISLIPNVARIYVEGMCKSLSLSPEH
jgi:hypothetical protein